MARTTKRTSARKAARRRHDIPKDIYSFMTPAEVRGEAAYMVLEILLRHIPRSMCRKVMAAAYVEADSLGHEAVTEEIECLFRGIAFGPPTI